MLGICVTLESLELTSLLQHRRTRTRVARLLVSPWIALAWAAVVFFAAPYLLATTAWLSAAPAGGVTSEIIAFARGGASAGQILSIPSEGSSTVVEDLDPEDDDDSDSDDLSAHRRTTSLDPSAAAGASDLRLDLAQPPPLELVLLVSSHLERAPFNKLSQTILRAYSARGPPSA